LFTSVTPIITLLVLRRLEIIGTQRVLWPNPQSKGEINMVLPEIKY
jgi:hypothetical protein